MPEIHCNTVVKLIVVDNIGKRDKYWFPIYEYGASLNYCTITLQAINRL